MTSGKKAAIVGLNGQKEFCKYLIKSPEFLKDYNKIIEFEQTPIIIQEQKSGKIDVIQFRGQGTQLKTVRSSADYNQIARISINNLVKKLNYPKYLATCLRRNMRKRLTNKKAKLFGDREGKEVLKWWRRNLRKALKLFFADGVNVPITIVINIEDAFYVVNLEDIYDYICSAPLIISKDGNLRTEDGTFTLQKKGGDGNVTTFPKDDIKHPSNDIQAKMKFRQLLECVPHEVLYKANYII